MKYSLQISALFKKHVPRIDTLLFLLLFMVLIPLITISFFVHPGLDDYLYAVKTERFGFWGAQLNWYNTWTGKYFSSFVMSGNPLVFGDFSLFKVIPIAFFLSFISALYLLIRTAFPELTVNGRLVLTAGMSIVYISCMPDLYQGFYWLTGTVVYQMGNILSLLFLTLLIKLYHKPRFDFFALSLLCLFAIIGSNETSMLFIVFFLSLALFIEWIQQQKISIYIVILFLFSVIFSLIVILAPGNKIRSSRYDNRHDLVFSVFYSGIKTIASFIDWMPGIILISIILFEFLKLLNLNARGRIFYLNPLFTFGLILLIPFIGVFPSSWSTGLPISPRVENTSLLYVVLGGFLLLVNVIHYAKKQRLQLVEITPTLTYLIAFVFILFTFRTENIRTVYFDLLSGRAAAYNAQLNDRYMRIQKATATDTIVLPKLEKVPSTIAGGELSSDPSFWNNIGMKSYFHSGPIMVEEK